METKRQFAARKLVEFFENNNIDVFQAALLLFLIPLTLMTINTIINLKSTDPDIRNKKISYGDIQLIIIVLIAFFIYVKMNF